MHALARREQVRAAGLFLSAAKCTRDKFSLGAGFPRVTRGDEINSAFNYKARPAADRALKSEQDIPAAVFTCHRNASQRRGVRFRLILPAVIMKGNSCD